MVGTGFAEINVSVDDDLVTRSGVIDDDVDCFGLPRSLNKIFQSLFKLFPVNEVEVRFFLTTRLDVLECTLVYEPKCWPYWSTK